MEEMQSAVVTKEWVGEGFKKCFGIWQFKDLIFSQNYTEIIAMT